MSEVYGDDVLGEFNAVEQERAALKERMELTLSRVRLALVDKGVEFEDAPVLTEFEVRARQLAGLVLLHEIAHEDAGVTDLDLKKNVQAAFLVRGYSQAWLEVVDAELPGEALDQEHDRELISQKQAEEIAVRAEIDQQFVTTLSLFMALYSGNSTHEVGTDEYTAILKLAQAYMVISAYRQFTRISWQEEARALLLSIGQQLTPRWQRIIEYGS